MVEGPTLADFCESRLASTPLPHVAYQIVGDFLGFLEYLIRLGPLLEHGAAQILPHDGSFSHSSVSTLNKVTGTVL